VVSTYLMVNITKCQIFAIATEGQNHRILQGSLAWYIHSCSELLHFLYPHIRMMSNFRHRYPWSKNTLYYACIFHDKELFTFVFRSILHAKKPLLYSGDSIAHITVGNKR
jgi:hypothetical protein